MKLKNRGRRGSALYGVVGALPLYGVVGALPLYGVVGALPL